MSDAAINQADWTMRNWAGPDPSNRVKIGSEQHKQLFCRMLLDTHNPYKPAVINWPKLAPDALRRITSLPIWDIAVQTEGRASIRVKTFAERVHDPLLRSALTLDADEEARHKVVLSKMVETYGIPLAPGTTVSGTEGLGVGVDGDRLQRVHRQPVFLRPVRGGAAIRLFPARAGGYLRAGHSGRNPAHYLLRQLGGVVPAQSAIVAATDVLLRTAAVWVFLGWERVGIARGLDDSGEMQDANFAVTGSEQLGIDINLRELVRTLPG